MMGRLSAVGRGAGGGGGTGHRVRCFASRARRRDWERWFCNASFRRTTPSLVTLLKNIGRDVLWLGIGARPIAAIAVGAADDIRRHNGAERGQRVQRAEVFKQTGR